MIKVSLESSIKHGEFYWSSMSSFEYCVWMTVQLKRKRNEEEEETNRCQHVEL